MIGFLNAVLEGEQVITDIQYLNNELKPEKVEGKTILYDLYCLTDKGEYIIVEMQNKDEHNFKDRSLFYVSRCIAEQGIRGDEWNYKLHPVYGIFFLNFRSPEGQVHWTPYNWLFLTHFRSQQLNTAMADVLTPHQPLLPL